MVRPGTAPSHARPAHSQIQIRINAAWQFGMIPIPAPFEGVAMHIMQPPCIRGITAHLGRATQRWSWLSSIVWLAFEVRLLAAQLVAERGRSCRSRSARVFPLRLRRQPELPIIREFARRAGKLRKLLAESLRFRKVYIPHRQIIARRQFGCELSGQISHDTLPVALGYLEFSHPKTARQCYLHLILARATIHFIRRTAHYEGAGRTPAYPHTRDLFFIACLQTEERIAGCPGFWRNWIANASAEPYSDRSKHSQSSYHRSSDLYFFFYAQLLFLPWNDEPSIWCLDLSFLELTSVRAPDLQCNHCYHLCHNQG